MWKAVGVVGIVIALSLVGGCGVADTGVRVAEDAGEGATTPTPAPPAATDDDEAFSVDPVEVLREDTGVPQDVKDMVAQPCSEGYGEGWYPVYTWYTTIAGTDVPVVIINVQQGCGDVVSCSGAYASYVYRLWEHRTERVYTAEGPMSEVSARGGELFVQRPTWEGGDPPDCPSSSDTVELTWNGSEFATEADG